MFVGQMFYFVFICVYNELVDFCKVGDCVEIMGIYKVIFVCVNFCMWMVKSVYKMYVDIVYVQKVDKKRMGNDFFVFDLVEEEEVYISGQSFDEIKKILLEDEVKIREIVVCVDIYEFLFWFFVLLIYEMEDVKKGIFFQLFGGINKIFEKGVSFCYCGDINVLLCGDFLMFKFQFLGYVYCIVFCGVYISGKGFFVVGFIVYVICDLEIRQLVFEFGVLVLFDGGVCCIDEFDKMNEFICFVFYEVMEQQIVFVVKVGIIIIFNVRIFILVFVNLIGSCYNFDFFVL